MPRTVLMVYGAFVFVVAVRLTALLAAALWSRLRNRWARHPRCPICHDAYCDADELAHHWAVAHGAT